MGVCKHTALIITPILAFPLAGGRNSLFKQSFRNSTTNPKQKKYCITLAPSKEKELLRCAPDK